MLVPKYIYLTKGKGEHKEKLASFEAALRDAGIAAQNIVEVSSIYPPHAQLVSRPKGEKLLVPGQILFCVLARNQTNEPHRLISSSIGLAMPADHSVHGYLSEHKGFGENATQSGDYAEDLAAEMLASTLGIDFNVDQSWDEKKQAFLMSGKIIKTSNITQTGVGPKDGKWLTTVAAAVMITQWVAPPAIK
ncbi:arginine decarboxylase, pyruvoyl-dependent [Desulfarculus baarsii DSM 2075]|uniref:Pyruvoyl-dependent arginine decarboxylase AaxB n=1 Tax=Desulfarculus baarsii (strain ATCC 33931 / DSM 2075 / LMG 7858 / VKM B-1802 / 2st14) TaxID=644282 RepID=E1QDK3_DESB2|nr:arginine decarboxylase, pyruvoyl-dependent [Desulfarculus baarsii]ADK83522.1 arginine decarboxylase, pyruvoyl-dependent [Desulfarculus baarsii DSM 2075]